MFAWQKMHLLHILLYYPFLHSDLSFSVLCLLLSLCCFYSFFILSVRLSSLQTLLPCREKSSPLHSLTHCPKSHPLSNRLLHHYLLPLRPLPLLENLRSHLPRSRHLHLHSPLQHLAPLPSLSHHLYRPRSLYQWVVKLSSTPSNQYRHGSSPRPPRLLLLSLHHIYVTLFESGLVVQIQADLSFTVNVYFVLSSPLILTPFVDTKWVRGLDLYSAFLYLRGTQNALLFWTHSHTLTHTH